MNGWYVLGGMLSTLAGMTVIQWRFYAWLRKEVKLIVHQELEPHLVAFNLHTADEARWRERLEHEFLSYR